MSDITSDPARAHLYPYEHEMCERAFERAKLTDAVAANRLRPAMRAIIEAAMSGHPAFCMAQGDTSSSADTEWQSLARSVKERIAEAAGFWKSCSGCYETEDGQNIHGYPHSAVFGCELGGGCSECGGIGAVWDFTDYGQMADEMHAEMVAEHATKVSGDAPQEAWQPIETAPKDGAWIDVWFQLTPDHGARWANVQWSHKRGTWINGPPSQYNGGWIATHWMPFPTSPVSRPHQRGGL